MIVARRLVDKRIGLGVAQVLGPDDHVGLRVPIPLVDGFALQLPAVIEEIEDDDVRGDPVAVGLRDGSLAGVYSKGIELAEQTYQQSADALNGKSPAPSEAVRQDPITGTTDVSNDGNK